MLKNAALIVQSASIEPIFSCSEPQTDFNLLDFSILTIDWYFGPLQTQSESILLGIEHPAVGCRAPAAVLEF